LVSHHVTYSAIKDSRQNDVKMSVKTEAIVVQHYTGWMRGVFHIALRVLGRLRGIPSDNDCVSQGWCAPLIDLFPLSDEAQVCGKRSHAPAFLLFFVL
jgi:hypothetical protein